VYSLLGLWKNLKNYSVFISKIQGTQTTTQLTKSISKSIIKNNFLIRHTKARSKEQRWFSLASQLVLINQKQ
jgi:hypothetical protein